MEHDQQRPMSKFVNDDGETFHAPPGFCFDRSGTLIDLIRRPSVEGNSFAMRRYETTVAEFQTLLSKRQLADAALRGSSTLEDIPA